MDRVNAMLKDVQIPPVFHVKQYFSESILDDVEATLYRQLEQLSPQIEYGQRIAITCGSRGLDRYADIIRALVSYVMQRGGQPFLVPAMGSHGGGTAEGQVELLARLGISEESTGAPILSSMETVQVGTTDRSLPIYIDKHAAEADGIILCNRIKPHTSFRGAYESGLVKMMAVGLANRKGAEMTHCLRFENMANNIADIGQHVLKRMNILLGVASIENGYGKLAELHVISPDAIFASEPSLLLHASSLMPRICLSEIDALIVSEIGKDISGTGMDTNIVGRFHTTTAYGGPNTIKLGLLDLSEKSAGNANGMGLADFVTTRLKDKIDYAATYMNSLISTEPNSTRLPMVLQSDKLVIQASLKLCGQLDTRKARLVLIRNTKDLGDVFMSEAAIANIYPDANVEIDTHSRPLLFDDKGNLLLFLPRP